MDFISSKSQSSLRHLVKPKYNCNCPELDDSVFLLESPDFYKIERYLKIALLTDVLCEQLRSIMILSILST